MPDDAPKTVKVRVVRWAPEPGGFHSGKQQHRIIEYPAGWSLPQHFFPVTDESVQLTPDGTWLDGDGEPAVAVEVSPNSAALPSIMPEQPESGALSEAAATNEEEPKP